MNKDKAYILGVLFGDGSIARRITKRIGKIPSQLILHVKDKDFAEYFCKIAKREGYNPKISFKIEGSTKLVIVKKPCKMYWVRICDTKFAQECFVLINKRKNIPKEIFNSNTGCKKMFIKGVMDSEGWIGIHRRDDIKKGYNYSMGFGVKDNFIYDLKRLFKDVGIRTNKVLVHKHNKIKYFRIKMWDYYDSKIGFSIKRKQDRLDDFGENFGRIIGYHKVEVAYNRRLDINNKDVVELYLNKRKSVIEISKIFNCSFVTICNRLKEENIERRGHIKK